jgi:hypothetical protein
MKYLPNQFCWTRYGTEAAQTIDQILQRKEEERKANGGIFFWGIGNAIAPSMKRLLELEQEPQVVFSPIKGKPRKVDVQPSAVAVWTAARCLQGKPFRLPPAAIITSRYDESSPRQHHFALVCYSSEPLKIDDAKTFVQLSKMRNLRTGALIGASQTTAVVSLAPEDIRCEREYPISFRFRLAPPYLIELAGPVPVSYDFGLDRQIDWATERRTLESATVNHPPQLSLALA